MRVIYKTKTTTVEREYSNIDIATPIDGLNKIKVNGKLKNVAKTSDDYIKIYFIKEEKIENTNPEQYTIVKDIDIFTTTVHSDYAHLLICRRTYKALETPKESVIEKLNTDLGEFLDREYPLFKRDSDTRKLLFNNVPIQEIDYINEVDLWLNECRVIRDKKELDYLENNVFPTFNDYPIKPIKNI